MLTQINKRFDEEFPEYEMEAGDVWTKEVAGDIKKFYTKEIQALLEEIIPPERTMETASDEHHFWQTGWNLCRKYIIDKIKGE